MISHALHQHNGQDIAEIQGDVTIRDAGQFLELMMNLPAERIILHKRNLDQSFFDLRTGLAGEILQKVVNYRCRLAIVGDFSAYESKSLRDFIYESNRGNTVMFLDSVQTALARLA